MPGPIPGYEKKAGHIKPGYRLEYDCKFCNEHFTNYKALRVHKKEVHSY